MPSYGSNKYYKIRIIISLLIFSLCRLSCTGKQIMKIKGCKEWLDEVVNKIIPHYVSF